jgi:hypothetical protein
MADTSETRPKGTIAEHLHIPADAHRMDVQNEHGVHEARHK